MLSDKEVGDIFRRINDDQLWTDEHKYIRYDYRRLIDKLVEDRAERYSIEDCGKPRGWWGDVFPLSYTNSAHRDFGIPEI